MKVAGTHLKLLWMVFILLDGALQTRAQFQPPEIEFPAVTFTAVTPIGLLPIQIPSMRPDLSFDVLPVSPQRNFDLLPYFRRPYRSDQAPGPSDLPAASPRLRMMQRRPPGIQPGSRNSNARKYLLCIGTRRHTINTIVIQNRSRLKPVVTKAMASIT